MVRFCLIAVAICLGTFGSTGVYAQNSNNNNGGFSGSNGSNNNGDRQSQHPQLLSYDQQQELLSQLAQLQRQTQQLLAAQQSLAAVAAAAASNSQNGPQPQSSSRQQTSSSSQQQQSSNQRQQQQSNNGNQQRNQQPAASSSQQNQQSAALIQKPQQSQQSQQQQSGHISNHQQQPSEPISNQISSQSGSTNQAPPLPAGPQINWGKCPELEPSESEKLAKAGVITKCLETTPLPSNITRESVEQHREQIAACALRAEGWFTGAGGYDFGKAEKEIKNKQLHKDLESQVLSYHSQCKTESEEKYPLSNSSIIAQIQLYQACMDYFISDVCGIEVNEPEAQQF